MSAQTTSDRFLIAIKTLHTLVWLVMVACILGIPIAGLLRHFALALFLTAIVLGECLVLAANGGRCPMTDLAGLYTKQRAENFDIYLPLWLARHNKTIFGILFLVGGLFTLAIWLISSK